MICSQCNHAFEIPAIQKVDPAAPIDSAQKRNAIHRFTEAKPPQGPREGRTVDSPTMVGALVLVVVIIIVGVFWQTAASWISGILFVCAIVTLSSHAKNSAQTPSEIDEANNPRTRTQAGWVLLVACLLAVVVWIAPEESTEADGGDAPRAEASTGDTSKPATQQIEIDEANKMVHLLVQQAKKDLEYGLVDLAERKLTQIKGIAHAQSLESAQELESRIKVATDPDMIRATLVSLTERDFQAVKSGKSVPPKLSFGFKVLDESAANLITQNLEVAEAERKKIKERKRAELAKKRARERALAEAKRRAEQEKQRKKARAAAEATRKERPEREERKKAKSEKRMGQTLSVGYTSYCVWKAWFSDRLSSNQFLNERANAKWLFLDVSVTNNDKKARLVPKQAYHGALLGGGWACGRRAQ